MPLKILKKGIKLKTVILIADFFKEEINAGAENFNAELWKSLKEKDYDIIGFKSQDLSVQIIKANKQCFFIIANFMMLSEQAKQELMNGYNYLILEHDFKLAKSNNASLYNNFFIPEDQIQNKEFFRKAKFVFCQSHLHAEIYRKNTLFDNIINLSCNLWSDDDLKSLEQNLNKSKTRKYGVLNSINKNKGTQQTIEYCKKNNIPYELINQCSQKEFYSELAKTETLVFLPAWFESYSRVVIEARILGCKLITNKSVGCASEAYFGLKGKDLLKEIKRRKEYVINSFVDAIEGEDVLAEEVLLVLPKVSVISTVYNGEDFIEGFLETYKQQTYQNKELLILDANSTDKTKEKFNKWRESNKDLDIKYIKHDEKITTSKAFNILTEMSRGEYISILLMDDRWAYDYLEVMAKHLYNNKDIDLFYSTVLQTRAPHETFTQNSSKGRAFETSNAEFSKEAMIKCLPSPTQMYRKSMHTKINGWNESYLFACDWDFFLRAVDSGSAFQKVNKPLALYYWNEDGLSTGNKDQEKTLNRRKEEKETFFKFKHLYPKNFELFKMYFENL